MQVIYNLFYGALLQKLQAVLKWKLICGNDVSKCYQQSTGLAKLGAREVERHLLAEYFKSVHHNCNHRKSFNGIKDSKQFAIHIAKGYTNWTEVRRRETTDKVFRMILNFVAVMNLYRAFRVTVCAGNAIVIEVIYREMLPLFGITAKKHYSKISLKQMEGLYEHISYKYLHLTRINRTVLLYSGFDKQGDPMANWAMDGLIETVQKYYHKMNFNTGKPNAWLKHSSHVMVMSKASSTVMEEYSRLNNVEDHNSKLVDHKDTNLKTMKGVKSVKNSSSPKREREACAVAEYLLLSKMTREIPDCKYEAKVMWDVLSECTVELISESEKARAERMVRESQTEEEIMLDRFTGSLYGTGSALSTDDGNEIIDLTDDYCRDNRT